MNKIFIVLLIITFSCTSGVKKSNEKGIDDHADHQHEMHAEEGNKNVKSPHTAAMTTIGENHIHIDYSSPRVRGRQVFGGLVAYNEVWSTGAHNATSISFTHDVEIENTLIKAGKYGLFTIPGEETWTIILNSNWDQHLTDEYDVQDDALRFSVIPKISDCLKEELTFNVIARDENSGAIQFQWEKVTFEFHINNN